MTYDDILSKIVGRRFEIKMFILFFVNGIPNAFVLASIPLIMYIPKDYRCALPEYVSEFTAGNSTIQNAAIDFMIPPATEETEGKRSKCLIYNRTREEYLSFTWMNQNASASVNTTTLTCEKHYFADPYGKLTAAMEFDFTCDNNWMVPVFSSLYVAGLIFGAVGGFLSDRFGRRPVFIGFTFLMFLMLFIESFSTSFWMLAIMLFFNGVAGLVNYVSGFVLGSELTVPEKRNFLCISSFLSFSFAYGLCSIIWFLSPDWRWFLRICGLIGLLYTANYWVTPESPRWLMSNGRIDEGKKLLERIAKSDNKCDISDELLNDIEKEALNLMEQEKKEEALKEGRGLSGRRILADIFKSPPMIVLLLTSAYSWFSVAMMYYGISLSVQALSGNLLVNNALMGFVEIPGIIVAYFAVKYISRPASHGGMIIISGIFCMGAALLSEVSHDASSAAGLMGKALIAGTFYLVFIHTAEVFPTLTRNTCMSLGQLAGRFGAILAPYFSHLGILYGMYTPYLVMSIITISSGILTLLFYPETKDAVLPETVDDSLALPTLLEKYGCRRRKKYRRARTDKLLPSCAEENVKVV